MPPAFSIPPLDRAGEQGSAGRRDKRSVLQTAAPAPVGPCLFRAGFRPAISRSRLPVRYWPSFLSLRGLQRRLAPDRADERAFSVIVSGNGALLPQPCRRLCALRVVIGGLRLSDGGGPAISLHRDSLPASNHIAPARPTRQLSPALARFRMARDPFLAEHSTGFDGIAFINIQRRQLAADAKS